MNMQNLMAQAQKVEREISAAREQINNQIFNGESKFIKIECNGKKEILKVTIIDPNSLKPDIAEILEDMILLAAKDAFQKVEQEVNNKMSKYGQSLKGLI